jgi:heme A synthase
MKAPTLYWVQLTLGVLMVITKGLAWEPRLQYLWGLLVIISSIWLLSI